MLCDVWRVPHCCSGSQSVLIESEIISMSSNRVSVVRLNSPHARHPGVSCTIRCCLANNYNQLKINYKKCDLTGDHVKWMECVKNSVQRTLY